MEDMPDEIILSVSLPLSLRVKVPQLWLGPSSSSGFDSLLVPDIMSSVEGERLNDSVAGDTISLRNVIMEPLLPNSSTLRRKKNWL